MSSKIDKETLKGPDTFISTSEKVFKWVEKHSRLMIFAAAGVLAASLLWVGYGFWQTRQETRAAEALYPSQHEIKQLVEKNGDVAVAIEALKSAMKAHASAKATLISGLEVSQALLKQKKFDAALQILEIPTYRPAKDDVLFALAYMHKGLVLAENNKFDDAIKSYELVVAADQLKSFHAEALVKIGLMQEAKGEVDKARLSYERVGREFPNTEAAISAGQYLRLLGIKSTAG